VAARARASRPRASRARSGRAPRAPARGRRPPWRRRGRARRSRGTRAKLTWTSRAPAATQPSITCRVPAIVPAGVLLPRALHRRAGVVDDARPASAATTASRSPRSRTTVSTRGFGSAGGRRTSARTAAPSPTSRATSAPPRKPPAPVTTVTGRRRGTARQACAAFAPSAGRAPSSTHRTTAVRPRWSPAAPCRPRARDGTRRPPRGARRTAGACRSPGRSRCVARRRAQRPRPRACSPCGRSGPGARARSGGRDKRRAMSARSGAALTVRDDVRFQAVARSTRAAAGRCHPRSGRAHATRSNARFGSPPSRARSTVSPSISPSSARRR